MTCSFLAEGGAQLGEREGVDDVFFLEPAFAGDAGAEAEVTGVGVAVGVAIDDAFDAFIAGVMPEAPIEIEAMGAAFSSSQVPVAAQASMTAV